jgi:hypothetical protein
MAPMAACVPLSVVIPVRDGVEEIEQVLRALLPQARATGTEVLVVGRAEGPAPDGVRIVRVEDDDIYRLRLEGIEAARGALIAIGEDHAVPRPDWCAAVIRAHAERPAAPAVIGCLSNATDRTLSGRGNFLAFAAPFGPPLAKPLRRPPPSSAISFKREALHEGRGRVGWFESVLMPRLFEEGRLAVDARIVVDHYQDHGIVWSIVNGFHSARGSYGYASRGLPRADRAAQARWSLRHWPPRLIAEARAAVAGEPGHAADLAMVAVVAVAAAVGGAVGSLAGPGSSPRRVA